MRNTDIEHLLQAYNEGNILPEQKQQLEQLTERDSVMSNAMRQAATLRHRRAVVVAALTAILLPTAALIALYGGNIPRTEVSQSAQNRNASLPPTVAQTEATKTTFQVLTSETEVEQKTPISSARVDKQASAATLSGTSSPATQVMKTSAPQDQQLATEPIVICNNQCDADSVINEIMKFLSA